jgi:hypothetical protein
MQSVFNEMRLNDRVKIIECDMHMRELGLGPVKAGFIKLVSYKAG